MAKDHLADLKVLVFNHYRMIPSAYLMLWFSRCAPGLPVHQTLYILKPIWIVPLLLILPVILYNTHARYNITIMFSPI